MRRYFRGCRKSEVMMRELRMDEAGYYGKRCGMLIRATLLFLMGGYGTGVVMGAEAWPDPVGNDVVPYQTSPMTHGPVLGDVSSESVRVWIRTGEAMPFEVVYGTDLPLDGESLVVAGETLAEADGTGYVELRELEANTRYYYGIRIEGEIADTRMEFDRPWPSFRTLPDATSYADAEGNPEGLFNFSFSISVGQRQKSPDGNFGIYGNPPAFLTLWKEHGEDVLFHIVNGDYTYEELLDGTAGGYENNYKLYLERGRNVSNFLRYVPMFTMYDDHEVNSNLDGAGEIGAGDGDYLVRDAGLRAWQHYGEWANGESAGRGKLYFGEATVEGGGDVLFDAEADFSELDAEKVSTIHVGNYIKGDGRSRAARGGKNIGVYGLVEVLDEHRLRVEPAFKEDGKASYSIGTHHYFDRVVGNCHFFFLDGRGERSRWLGPARSHDEDRFILGERQREWLMEGVRDTEADFIFVIFPDPWVMYHTAHHVKPGSLDSKGDGFAGYVWEREQMMPLFDEVEKPILLLTGDLHHPFAVQITDNVWEFLSSPTNSAGHPMGTAGLPPMGGWFDSEGRVVKIKWAGGYPDNVHYLRQRNTVYTVIQVNNVVKAGRPDGVGYQWIAFDEPQVLVQFYDGYTGKLLYAEGISTADAKRSREPAAKVSRFPDHLETKKEGKP
jgi:alkaline phosphatase D